MIRRCERFEKRKNMMVLKCLIDMGVSISEGADGCRVNLDQLTEKQLEMLKDKIDELDKPVDIRYQI